ncbi:hypothetical protein BGX38DRAFT_106406 [Terfezia claveryi]|nr:hypothetical protein BGX38DRAFT_106406 [Terfezia claveryi]
MLQSLLTAVKQCFLSFFLYLFQYFSEAVSFPGSIGVPINLLSCTRTQGAQEFLLPLPQIQHRVVYHERARFTWVRLGFLFYFYKPFSLAVPLGDHDESCRSPGGKGIHVVEAGPGMEHWTRDHWTPYFFNFFILKTYYLSR